MSAPALLLPADIYPLAAIQRAVAAHRGPARFTVHPGARHHRLEVEPADTPQDVVRELANRILALALAGDGDAA